MNQSYSYFADYQASQWYAVYTRHQHEKSVAENLAGRGLEVFLPTYEAVRQWRDRQKRVSFPLFPCYVFFRGNLETRVRVLSTPGVHSIVGFAGQPAVIERSEIEAIRVAVESHFGIEPHPFLRNGDRVRVKCGPLTGVEGILVRKRGLVRLVLSAELLQKSVSVEVDAHCIERVACHPEFTLRPIQSISSSHFKNTTG
jgi:transcription antitermination factor NusG